MTYQKFITKPIPIVQREHPITEKERMYLLLNRSATDPEKKPAITKGRTAAGPWAIEKFVIGPTTVRM